jgi:hypothetical protein
LLTSVQFVSVKDSLIKRVAIYAPAIPTTAIAMMTSILMIRGDLLWPFPPLARLGFGDRPFMPGQKGRTKTAQGKKSSGCTAHEAGMLQTYPPDPPCKLASFLINCLSSKVSFLKPER